MRIGRRMAVYLVVVVLVCLATAGGAFLVRLHFANARQQSMTLPSVPAPTRNGRVLVFAPHCDDEVLGTGGMIAETRAAGGKVRVVLMTNGDAFTMATARAFRHLPLTPTDYVKFGMMRQSETLRALGVLGVESEDVSFLGYPDRGLAPIWLTNWEPDKLYRSRYTASASSPYPNAFNPNAPYCGVNVLDDVKKIIQQFRPTVIYTAHPNDEHPDHWATNCFVSAALEELKEQHEFARKIELRTYLIHRGDWPVPQGLHRASRLVPPQPLVDTGTTWRSLLLNPRMVNLKYRAILCYKSQLSVMRRFMLSFVRDDELFGDDRIAMAPNLPKGALTIDGYPDDWRGIKPLIHDPVLDKLSRVDGSGDIRAVYAARDSEHLFLRAEMRDSLSPQVQYRIRLHPMTETNGRLQETNLEFAVRPPSRSKGHLRDFAWRGKMLELSIPLREIGPARSVMVSMDTQIGRIAMDRTAWRLTRLVPWPHESDRRAQRNTSKR